MADVTEAAEPVDDRPPRSSRELLLDGTFGTYLAARSFWASGIWVYTVAAAIVVFELTRSTFLVGLVSVAHFSPQLLLSPYSGSQADRGDRRRQVVVGRLISAAASSALVVWILVVGLQGHAGAAAVICAALLTGIGDALGAPAAHALVPAMVRPVELPAAVSLDAMPFTAARAIGPALGAFLVTGLGAVWAFAYAALASLTFAAIVQRLPLRTTRGGGAASEGSMRAGLAYLRRRPELAGLLIGVATIGLGVDPVITLAPSLAEQLGGTSRLVGAMASAFGVGAGATFFFLGAVRRRVGATTQSVTGLGCIALSMLLLAAAPVAGLAVASLVIGGVGYTLALTALTTGVQQGVEEGVRGRVMALWTVAFLGSRPVAASLNGAVADATSERIALLLVTAIVIAGAVTVALWARRPPAAASV